MPVGRKSVACVKYASPAVVPARLAVVALVDASGYTPPPGLLAVSTVTGSYVPLTNAPAGSQVLGAVTYTLGSVIPNGLKRVVMG
jgi:hypothetical protein